MSSIPYSRYVVYPVPWYSFLIVLGVALAVLMAWHEEKRLFLPKDTVLDLALWLIPCGIVGARIYYVIFSWDQFRYDLFSVFRVWEGGIAIYGGVIGGLLALLVFSRRRRLSPLVLCDMIAPGVALAQSIGRWGNWFNIEAYGLKITDRSLCFFPFAVQVPADGNAWHLATFFYESVWDFAVFMTLILLRKRYLCRKGDIFFFYLFLYAAGRLIIEELRLDSLYTGASVRVSQLLSIIICLCVMLRYMIVFCRSSNRFSITVLILSAVAGSVSVVVLLYTLSSSILSSWSPGWVVLFLAGYAILMISCLFIIRFRFLSLEVHDADD